MKPQRVFAGLTALALLLSLAACSGSKGFTSMHLVKTEGTVQVADGEGKSVRIISNLGLYSGYGVTTLTDSYGWILLDSTKLAKLDAVSAAEIRRSGKQLELYVRSGGLFFNVTEPLADDETMNIRTSSMVVGIRGTCGWVEVEDEDLMCVYLLKGQVECTVLDESGAVLAAQTITAGEAAKMVRADGEGTITVAEFDAENAPEFVSVELENGEPGTGTDEPKGPAGKPGNERTEGNIFWSLEDGILTISGTGNMEDYDFGFSPWKDETDTIQFAVIEPGVTSIGDNAFQGCRSLTSVTIPDSVTFIGNRAFYGCSKLESAAIPDGVTSIGDYTFYYCSALTGVTIPDNVTSIGECAFQQCHSLTSVTIPNSVTSIGKEAFSACSHLTSVTIPASVTSIEYGMFSGGFGLTSVTIPNSVTSISSHAFYNCTSLTDVYFNGTQEQFNTISIGVRNDPFWNATVHYVS